MNQLKKYLCLLFLSSLFFACKNKTGDSAANGDGASDSKGAANVSSSGGGSFSVVIDGETVSGKGTDELQLRNTAFIYPAQDNHDKYILFDLNSDKQGDDFYGFRIYTPDKEGAFTMAEGKKNGYRCSVRLDYNLRSKDNFAVYTGDSVTVTIDKISSTGISGSFSGSCGLSDLTRSKQYKMRIQVTDGKFEIPFSTGNIRPE